MVADGIDFNTIRDPWIDTAKGRMGIADVLHHSPTLDGIVDINPLSMFGTLRLLMVIVADAYRIGSTADAKKIIEADKFDSRIDEYLDKQFHKFDLFSSSGQNPFMQRLEAELKKGELKKDEDRSVVKIMPMLSPTTTPRFYQHMAEKDVSISLPICARALVALPAFTAQGGSGWRASINGAPPLYVLVRGKSLFETLLLNAPAPAAGDPGTPTWRLATVSSDKPTRCDGPLMAMTWLPRFILLDPPTQGQCIVTGEEGPVVSTLYYAHGMYPNREFLIEDPSVCYIERKKNDLKSLLTSDRQLWSAYYGGRNKKLVKDSYLHLWRLLPLLTVNKSKSPLTVKNAIAIMSRAEVKEIRIECYNLVTSEASIIEWIRQEYPLPYNEDFTLSYEDMAYAEKNAVRVWACVFKTMVRMRIEKTGQQNVNDETEKKFASVANRAKDDYWHRMDRHKEKLLLGRSDEWRSDVESEGYEAINDAIPDDLSAYPMLIRALDAYSNPVKLKETS